MKYKTNKFIKQIKNNKIIVLSIAFTVLLIISIAIPTLSQYKTTTPTDNITSWDGTTANSYYDGNGSKEEPYIISNGSELSYFASQLKTTNYEGKYFVLNNDIVLNDGIFNYDKNNGIKYTKDGAENIVIPNTENNTFNIFEPLNGFKGTFDGNYHTIYGLYIDESLDEQNALFTNLEGNISNLYIKNSIIHGGKIVAGVASKTKNANLTNVSYDGFVVSDNDISNKTITLEINDIEKNTITELNDNINISNLTSIPGIITEITLSGNFQTDNEESMLKINGEIITPGEFKINLNNEIKPNIPIIYQTNTESTFSLNNLKYEIKYEYSNAAGIVSIAENTTLKNIINNSNVYAIVYASGIANTVSGTASLKNVYNTGSIESNNTSSGLITSINQNTEDITITNCYNKGSLISNNNSMIGNIEKNVGIITLTNIFNTTDDFVINLIDGTNVTINNSYTIFNKKINIGESNGEIIQTTLENLKTKSFIQEKLKFQEYTNEENIEDNVWLWSFDIDTLPTLYIDEVNKPIANIYLKENIWKNYKSNLDTLKFSDKLVFSIEEENQLNHPKEIYYYISNEKEVLTKKGLNDITNWEKYENIVEIEEEGFYVVYVKIIDDNNNDIYLNTDLLVIDLTGSNITISSSYNNDTWNELKTNLNNYYIDRKISIDIKAEDSLSGINKIYYYISDTVLKQEDLETLEEWTEYTEEFYITSKESIVYAKAIDNCNYSTYANSDLFILNGYTLNSISPGMNGDTTKNIHITEKSSVSLNYSYQDTNEYVAGNKHQIVSNILLPENTKITLIDKIKNKVYVYKTTNNDYGYNDCNAEVCVATYDFELFDEVGSSAKFNESNYTGLINENFVVIFDFNEAIINDNVEEISISLKIDNENANEVRSTLIDSLEKFNIIFKNSHPSITLNTTFEETINYSDNTKYIIDFSAKINYQKINENKIFDTTFEDKNLGLSIKMINDNGDIIPKKYLKNIAFKIGDKKYLPSNDGIIRINLEKGVNDISDNLVIQTYSDNSNLEEGNYKFIINLYAAYDGINSNEVLSNIEIPVYVGKNIYKNDNSFNVIMNNEDKIISTKENEFDFEFLIDSITENTNIKMSLYKKTSLSAYDQNYTIVDLKEYLVDNKFEQYDKNIYYAFKKIEETNTLKINLDTSLLEKRGYMFIFELYEDDKLVNKISKKFIVK